MEKTVLIVDDEKKFLESLVEGLYAYVSQFKVVTASDGREAVKVLNSQSVDLVVTDLKMPEMDGFALIAHMSDQFPLIPVIVMSAFANSSIEEKIELAGGLQFLGKPLEFDELVNAIFSALSSAKDAGNISGFEIGSFLQLIEMEKKSCALVIATAGQENGFFLFKEGDLLDASYNNLRGREAAIEMLSLKDVLMKIKRLPNKKLTKRIKDGVMPILMKHAQNKDEKAETEDDPALKIDLDELDPAEQNDVRIKPSAADGQTTEEAQPKKDQIISTQKINTIALENLLKELNWAGGLKEVGILTFTGELLASQSLASSPSTNLELVGALFNDIFRQSHETCGEIGLRGCEECIVSTPDGVIVLMCLGAKSSIHLHLVGVLEADGNQGLFKMQCKRLLPKFVAELA